MRHAGYNWFQWDDKVIAEYNPHTNEVNPVFMPLKTLFVAVKTAMRGTFI